MASSVPTAVVTGATAGVGLPLATGLARAGHRVLLGARDPQRAERALAAIRAAVPGAAVDAPALDLASLVSVRAFAARLPAEQVDLLVLNAGAMTGTRRETADGFELMLGTNHLGHAALLGLLLARLAAAPAPRVVTQSSEAHRGGRIDFDDLQLARRFTPVAAYNRSKLAQHLLAVELDRRLPVRSVVAQPGWVVSELGRDVLAHGGLLQRAGVRLGNHLVGQSPEAGAQPALRAALDPDAPGAATGRYLTPGRLRRLRGAPVVDDVAPRAVDPEVAARLWDVTQELTGVALDVPQERRAAQRR
jgi:NAD(P)-dependent dehydrogenase (short-subunit alcohol dehydrogenase family)